MKRLLKLLFIDSAKDLLKYKSFLLLILFIMLLDKGLKQFLPKKSELLEKPDLNEHLAAFSRWLFTDLPGQLLKVVTDYRVIILIFVGFLLKELLSMWPSSDMRRMHREEREKFGIFASLFALRWQQFLWDATAVLSICLMALLSWTIIYIICYFGWKGNQASFWGIIFMVGAIIFFTLGMAGFSYSSKLAVISRGTFGEKLVLFYKLFTNKKIFLSSWGFYTCRVLLEIFVLGIIPVAAHYFISHSFLRIILASVIACPVYSYLKMLSFKFFLEMYRPFDLVHNEYKEYYQNKAA